MNRNITDESCTDGLASIPPFPPPSINGTHCEALILEKSS